MCGAYVTPSFASNAGLCAVISIGILAFVRGFFLDLTVSVGLVFLARRSDLPIVPSQNTPASHLQQFSSTQKLLLGIAKVECCRKGNSLSKQLYGLVPK